MVAGIRYCFLTCVTCRGDTYHIHVHYSSCSTFWNTLKTYGPSNDPWGILLHATISPFYSFFFWPRNTMHGNRGMHATHIMHMVHIQVLPLNLSSPVPLPLLTSTLWLWCDLGSVSLRKLWAISLTICVSLTVKVRGRKSSFGSVAPRSVLKWTQDELSGFPRPTVFFWPLLIDLLMDLWPWWGSILWVGNLPFGLCHSDPCFQRRKIVKLK